MEARRLAVNNFNYTEIGEKLRVHKATISIWCRGLSSSDRWKTLIKNNESKRKEIVNSELHILENLKIDNNDAKLFCSILYGCEGSKYPASCGVMLTNSDPGMLQSFVSLMRKGFVLDENKWRAILQIHSDQNYKKLVDYWSDLLKIPSVKFFKPTITSPNGKKHRNIYYGTCTVRYYDYKIQLKLIGIFEEFMRKSSIIGGVA